MGRFAKLEIDRPGAETRKPVASDWVDMDEGRCMAVADDRYRNGVYEDALRHYSRALRFNRDIAAAWVGQIRCLLACGEWSEAVTWTDRALDRFAETPDLLACKGLALTHMGDIHGTSFLDSAVQMKGQSAWVWLARGECLLLRRTESCLGAQRKGRTLTPSGQESNADRCFLKAVEIAGDDWGVELRAGIAYNEARLYAKARGHLLAASRRAGNNPLAAYQCGVMHEGLGEAATAAGCYRRAIAYRPGYPEAVRALERVESGPAARLLNKLRQKV